MSTRVFFYGLYMDSRLLEDMGFHPESSGIAKLRNYRIHIGDRATLIPDTGSTAYGVLMTLPGDEASQLYARPEVAGYQAESVDVTLLNDASKQAAVSYILPEETPGAHPNTTYAKRLALLATQLGLPAAYAREISQFASDG
jgi:hypothetical protein